MNKRGAFMATGPGAFLGGIILLIGLRLLVVGAAGRLPARVHQQGRDTNRQLKEN
jgi:hypothetical protein